MPYDSPTQSPARAQFADETRSEKRIVERTDGVVEQLREELGDDLSLIAFYNEDVLEIHFVHETVREQYQQQGLDALASDLCLDARMGDAYQESLVQLGQLNFVVTGFDDGLLARVPLGQQVGVAVTTNLNAGDRITTLVPRVVEEHDIVVASRG
ncbi:hypothetical protein [Haloarchaeobius sp. HME9146]|uniref:DUF7522 family protein n=1 Tax=Haloarchaeobius sp. HME9146 TaxID=2978732 RepID=UPI0021BEB098|nr:hypothetical protein [Haloarchaeobius sp. HME9146]MCT9096041.1 hypothetical protein [Haloarchaeobius sp. HME9146]